MVEFLAILMLLLAAATVFRWSRPLRIIVGQSLMFRRQAGMTWSNVLLVTLQWVFDGRWSALSAALARPAPLVAVYALRAWTPPPRACAPLGSPPGRLPGVWPVDSVAGDLGWSLRN